jgi:peptidoglycan/LPS O-acetylase OafA/YrhL
LGETRRWGAVVDLSALSIVAMVLLAAFPLKFITWSVLGFAYMGLLALPFLVMLFGLTCDGATSVVSRVLQQPPARWLGTVSYSLYLSHTLISSYPEFFILRGVHPTPACHDDSAECKQLWADLYHRRDIPGWVALPMCAAALPLAWLTYTFVEEPARKYLCALQQVRVSEA